MVEGYGGSLTCEACQILDIADGDAGDDKLYAMVSHVHHEGRHFEKLKTTQDHMADRITSFVGSMTFIYMHGVWFACWVLLGLGAVGGALAFDKFPFGLLTLIVSLEAIFLTTFVMISQGRVAARQESRSDIDFENNLRAEIWSVHIGQQLGIDSSHVEEIVKATIEGHRSGNRVGTPES